MNHREIILPVYVAVACLSCVRDEQAKKNDDPGTAPPVTAAPVPNDAPSEDAAPQPAPAPSALSYDDKNDLPQNAGDARCPDAPPSNAKTASVQLEVSAKPPGIDIVIPSLGVKQRLWPGANNPSECHAGLVSGKTALRFHCSEDLSSVDGKVYVRRSDVVVGRTNPSGTTSTKFVLPCGTVPKLEAVKCPAECKTTDGQCQCGTSKK